MVETITEDDLLKSLEDQWIVFETMAAPIRDE
jgi:hypothetical protein